MKKIEKISLILLGLMLIGLFISLPIKFPDVCGYDYSTRINDPCYTQTVNILAVLIFILPQLILLLISTVRIFIRDNFSVKDKLKSTSLLLAILVASLVLFAVFNNVHKQNAVPYIPYMPSGL